MKQVPFKEVKIDKAFYLDPLGIDEYLRIKTGRVEYKRYGFDSRYEISEDSLVYVKEE